MSATVRPYGTWPSPVSARLAASGSIRLRAVGRSGEDVYWTESRPEDGGRLAVVRWSGGEAPTEVTPPGANVRTRVHEYGGGAFAAADRTLVYAEFADQRLYRLPPRGGAVPLTPEGTWRYADLCLHPSGTWLVAVREDHGDAATEPVNQLVAVDLDGASGPGRVIARGHDFYSTPRVSPDGTRLSWLAWRHPHMPWDETEVWVADVRGREVAGARRVAGGNGDAVYQPGWSPDGTLHFVSEVSGWWNLYRLAPGGQPEPLHPIRAELGRPQWELGTSTWAFADQHRVVVALAEQGRWSLGVIDTRGGDLRRVPTDLQPGESLAVFPGHVVCVGRSSTVADAVVRIDLETGAHEVLRPASPVTLAPEVVSAAQPITFPTEGGGVAHAFHYPPRSGDCVGPPDERPPLIVLAHGGPTAAAIEQLNLELQYWTTRGFAVVDVNYRGSTGFGRAYRHALDTNWGVVDVRDCVSAARHLAREGLVDPSRLIVRGRSAGGYVTLAALAFLPEVFAAGASYYGIGDIEAMVRDTHKFESRYFDSLIGPYPEQRDVFVARSPIHAVDRLSCPLILFQGLEDRVVPPDQSRLMAEAVRRKGLPVALLEFEGEQHGFRRAESIVRALEAELSFYGAVFGFEPADTLPTLAIDNLEADAARDADT